MRMQKLAVLSDPEIRPMHQAALNTLVGCGVKILRPRMLDALLGRGLPVGAVAQTVRFPRAVIEDGAVKAEGTRSTHGYCI